jgi:phage regulator Rha-like protein
MNLITTQNLKEINGIAYMSSRDIAELFEKDHKNIIRDIRNILESLDGSDLSHEIKDERGYTTEFFLNKKMTYILVLGFSGEKALRLKSQVVDIFVKYEEVKNASPELIHQKAVVLIKAQLDVCDLLGVPKHLAQIEAVKSANTIFGVDYSKLLQIAPSQDNIKLDEVMLEPTEAAKKLGFKSAREFNKTLAEIGLQTKNPNGWLPTEKGEAFCTKHSWKKGSKSGYNLKWNVNKIKSIL